MKSIIQVRVCRNNMVHMTFLEGVGLGSSFIFLFWTVIRIMSSVLALVALDLTQILPGFTIWTRMPIVVVMDGMSISLVARVS